MKVIFIPIGFVLGSISFYLTRWIVNYTVDRRRKNENT